MYAVVASVSLVARSERIRRLEAVARERELQRQRIQISQTIHDTTAQSAYTLGLGLEDAIEKGGQVQPGVGRQAGGDVVPDQVDDVDAQAPDRRRADIQRK